MENDIERIIYEETETRLKKMGESNYQFPPRIKKIDIIIGIILIGICILLIILCMMGVIV